MIIGKNVVQKAGKRIVTEGALWTGHIVDTIVSVDTAHGNQASLDFKSILKITPDGLLFASYGNTTKTC